MDKKPKTKTSKPDKNAKAFEKFMKKVVDDRNKKVKNAKKKNK